MTPSLHPSHWAAAVAIAGTLILPGPTNTLLFLAGAKRGLRSSLSMVGAELTGYTIAILCWIGFLDLLAARFPAGPVIVRACAAAYLAYLALTMLRNPVPAASRPVARGQRRRDLFCATLLNPKAFFFAAYVFPAASAGSEAILYRYFLFASLAVPIGYCWLAAGAALGASGAGEGARLRLFQRMAAVVLAVFSASLWVTVLR